MTLTGRDLVKLQLPALAALLLLGLAALLAVWSAGEADKAQQDQTAAAGRKNQIEQRLRQVRTEEQELKERARIFVQLQNAGIAGDEKRLEWTELLRTVQRELHIPGMTYEFGAQYPLETVDGAAYAWFSSPLRLQLQVLHEGDLLDFLARIEREAPAMVLVRNCQLNRGEAAAETRAADAPLKAECELQWVTARRVSGKP